MTPEQAEQAAAAADGQLPAGCSGAACSRAARMLIMPSTEQRRRAQQQQRCSAGPCCVRLGWLAGCIRAVRSACRGPSSHSCCRGSCIRAEPLSICCGSLPTQPHMQARTARHTGRECLPKAHLYFFAALCGQTAADSVCCCRFLWARILPLAGLQRRRPLGRCLCSISILAGCCCDATGAAACRSEAESCCIAPAMRPTS